MNRKGRRVIAGSLCVLVTMCGSSLSPLIGTWNTTTVPTTIEGLIVNTMTVTAEFNADKTMLINAQLGFAPKAVINAGCTEVDVLKGTWSTTSTTDDGTLTLTVDAANSTQLSTACTSSADNTPNGVAAGPSQLTLGIFNGLSGRYSITGTTLTVDATLPVVGATTLSFVRQN